MERVEQSLWFGAGCVLAAFIGHFIRAKRKAPRLRTLAGTRISNRSQYPKRRDSIHRYPWGNRFLSFEQLTKGGLYVGAPGSGKTLSIKLLLQEVLPRIVSTQPNGRTVSAIIYDSKTDFIPFLAGKEMASIKEHPDKVIIFNPLDDRAKALDIAAGVTNRLQVKTIAEQIIPADPEKLGPNYYFSKAAQTILAKVILGLHLHLPQRWTLKDLVIICQSERKMRKLLAASPATASILEEHFQEGPTFHSIRSTLATFLGELEEIAMIWDHLAKRGRTFTAAEFVKRSRLLVLGNNHRSRQPIQVMNRLLLTQVQAHILDQPDDPNHESWIILDEFRELGKIQAFTDFLVTCRAKNAPVILGLQDIAGLEQIYAPPAVSEILGCMNNLAIFHINDGSTKTQRWAADTLGQCDRERLQRSQSESHGSHRDQSTDGVSISRVREDYWMPCEFSRRLPMLPNCGALNGVYLVDGEPSIDRISAKALFKRISRDDSSVEARSEVENTPAEIGLRWNRDDERRWQDSKGLIQEPKLLPPGKPASQGRSSRQIR